VPVSYRVYEFRATDRARLRDELTVEPIWRLGYNERDASHFDVNRATFFVMLEGDERDLQLADVVLLQFGRRPPNWEQLARYLRAEDTASAIALGALFGPVEPQVKPAPVKAPPKEGSLAWRIARVREQAQDYLPRRNREAAAWKLWRWHLPLAWQRRRAQRKSGRTT